MVDVIRDIEVLENLLIAFQEGASDEKRMAVNAVERLLKEKQKIVDDFEKEFCDDTTETIAA
jgi:replicative superfamily II helicase